MAASRTLRLRKIGAGASALADDARELYEAVQARLEKKPDDQGLLDLAGWLDSLCDALEDAVHYADGAVKELGAQ
jgi:hypothetical protein